MPAIQPCAVLIVVDPDWRVETVSANVTLIADTQPEAVLGRPISDLIGEDSAHALRNRVSWIAGDGGEALDLAARWGTMTTDVRVTCHGARHLIEAEASVEPRLADAIGMVRSMIDRLTQEDPVAMAGQATRLVKALTGFERIWLCDGHGTFVAGTRPVEACGGSAAPRVIDDIDAQSFAVIGRSEDALLSVAAFRAPGAEEIASHAKDGSVSSMTFPVAIDGELLATLHARHSRARRCGAERRSVAHMFAEQLVARMMRRGWAPER